MLNETRLKVYVHAYDVRLKRGHLLEDIDNDYLRLNRLTEEDIIQIHTALGLY